MGPDAGAGSESDEEDFFAGKVGYVTSRVRSHCRFRNRSTGCLSASVMKWMSGSTERNATEP